MKKRFKAALLASVSVMTIMGAQSAFATKGMNDTPITAHVATFIGFAAAAPINTADDVDWYVYQNKSGARQQIYPNLQSPSGKNLNLQLVHMDPDGTTDSWVAQDDGPGGIDVTTLPVDPGGVVYFRIYPKTASDYGTGYYTFEIAGSWS